MQVHSFDGLDWTGLRATRAAPPPAAAANAARRGVYALALEQAEQMFRAASTVDPATKPVLIYYGLNQAGRAIAAAAANAGSDWQLRGHGLKARDLDGPIGAVVLFGDDTANGSFKRLSTILGSPVWDGREAISLAELWDTLPGNWNWPLTPSVVRRIALPFTLHDWDQQTHPMFSAFMYVPSSMLGAAGGRGQALRNLMAAYPQAAGFSYVRAGDDPAADPNLSVADDGWVSVTLTFKVHDDGRSASAGEHRAAFQAIASRHSDGWHLVPVLGKNAAPLHPLMAWWGVMYTLSMLARYQPAEWGDHIDVDASTSAVAIEQLLARAMEELPRLIGHTINQVS